MAFVTTKTESITGKYLYSDTYAEIPKVLSDTWWVRYERSFLNACAAIPFIGPLAGAARCALAIIHIIGHLFAALIFWDSGHLVHALKGCAEWLRGGIEIMPVLGRLFVWLYDAPGYERFPCFRMPYGHPVERWSFFLIKIHHPDKPDKIDQEILAELNYRFSQV